MDLYNNFNNDTYTDFSNETNKKVIANIGGDKSSRSKFNLWKLLVPIIAVTIIGGVFFGVRFLVKNNKEEKQKLLDQEIASTPIVVENNNNMYALYNSEGNMLTDFDYEKIGEFLSNVSVVRKPNSVYGVLDNSGKVVIDFSKYKDISRVGHLFKATDNEYDDYLLNTKGEVVYSLDELNAYAKSFYDSNKIVVVENTEFYDVLGVSGNSILKLDKLNYNDKVELYICGEDYATVYYNNVSYIVNLDKEKVVNKVNSNTLHYVTSYDINNTDRYILTDKTNGSSLSMKDFKLMDKDNVSYIKQCSSMFFSDSDVVCAKGYNGRYYLDDKGNDGVEYYLSNNINIDYDTYVYFENGKKGTFYKDGKKMTTIDCVNSYASATFSPIADKEKEIFILHDACSTKNGKYYYYYSDGTKFVDKEFNFVSQFDDNGFAYVSEDKDKYYLLSNEGKKITSDYDFITFNSSNYVYFDFHNTVYYAKLGDQYVVLNTEGEEIFKTKGKIKIYFNYFTVEENSELIYYTLKAKEFYRK